MGKGDMSEPVFEPIPVTYVGRFADDHFVDAQQFGKSIVASSRIANSICHLFLFSEITNDTRPYQVRFYVGPSKENGFVQDLFALMNSGQFAAFSPILMHVGRHFIERAFCAIIETVVGKKDKADAAMETIREMANRHTDFAESVHSGHMRDKAWLQEMVESLVLVNRASLREVPEPVGRSVREMRIGHSTDAATIDEPAAEVLRSHQSLTIGDLSTYLVRMEGVFKTNGACRVRLLDSGRIVPGKITDPTLGQPGNVYTVALNDDVPLRIVAKPTLKDGEINRQKMGK